MNTDFEATTKGVHQARWSYHRSGTTLPRPDGW